MSHASALANGVFHIPLGIGNGYMVATRRGWYLVDILLTHGHFDHAGNAAELSDHWDAQVFAHKLELPFLTGKDKYPPPDPTVGGFMGFMIRFFPNKAYDLEDRVDQFPRNPLPGWQMVETPGHSPGHVSFFRESDRALIAGDAITTVRQCNMVAMISQEPEVWLPPEYYTCNWNQARESVERLAALDPSVIAAGHGKPMRGDLALRQLQQLAEDWPAPEGGRYTEEPALSPFLRSRSIPWQPVSMEPRRCWAPQEFLLC